MRIGHNISNLSISAIAKIVTGRYCLMWNAKLFHIHLPSTSSHLTTPPRTSHIAPAPHHTTTTTLHGYNATRPLRTPRDAIRPEQNERDDARRDTTRHDTTQTQHDATGIERPQRDEKQAGGKGVQGTPTFLFF